MAYYKVKFGCPRCGCVWKGRLKTLQHPDPPCPNLACGVTHEPRGMDFTSGKAPAAVGMSVSTKAIDETARIVMQDHGLTNLSDNVRQGDVMAPKLPPAQQARADNFFGGGGRKRGGGVDFGAIGRGAMRGAFRPGVGGTPDAVQMQHQARARTPIKIVAGDDK